MTELRPGSKYFPLYQYLQRQVKDRIEMSFAEIEALIGEPLPESARTSRAFWSNRSTGYQSQAWLGNDLLVDQLDQEGETVRWRRIGHGYQVRSGEGGVEWDSQAVRALREHMDLSQDELAELMGVRQQTISEWETGAYGPSRSSAKHLGLIAEKAEFPYRVERDKTSEKGLDRLSGNG